MSRTYRRRGQRHDCVWVLRDYRRVDGALIPFLKLPDDKLLIPGVVSHCVYQVEPPELVAERIERFASVVGRERVIAGTDCGFASARAGTRCIRTWRGRS